MKKEKIYPRAPRYKRTRKLSFNLRISEEEEDKKPSSTKRNLKYDEVEEA